jgi:hypothetical protein
MCGSGIGGEALLLQKPKTGSFVGDVPLGKLVVFEMAKPWEHDVCRKCYFVDEDRQYITGDCPRCGNSEQVEMRVESPQEKFKENLTLAACGLIFFGGMGLLGFGAWWLHYYVTH